MTGNGSSVHRGFSNPPADVVFSVTDDIVWASWVTGASVKLGRYESVMTMMQDFLDQCEIGERLVQKSGESS